MTLNRREFVQLAAAMGAPVSAESDWKTRAERVERSARPFTRAGIYSNHAWFWQDYDRPPNSASATSASLIAKGFTAAHDPRDPSEEVVHGPAASVRGNLEDLGQFAGALDLRADPQNLPDGLTTRKWPADTFAQIGSGDYGSAYHERGEIYDLVLDSKITGFAIGSSAPFAVPGRSASG
jgi:hypothetical protein